MFTNLRSQDTCTKSEQDPEWLVNRIRWLFKRSLFLSKWSEPDMNMWMLNPLDESKLDDVTAFDFCCQVSPEKFAFLYLIVIQKLLRQLQETPWVSSSYDK